MRVEKLSHRDVAIFRLRLELFPIWALPDGSISNTLRERVKGMRVNSLVVESLEALSEKAINDGLR